MAMGRSTITKMLLDSENIIALAAQHHAAKLKRQRELTFDGIDKALIMWFKQVGALFRALSPASARSNRMSW